MKSEAELRFEVGSVAAFFPAGLAGLAAAGWLTGTPWNLSLCLAIAEAGGLAAGFIQGATLRKKLLSAISFSAFAITETVATVLYLGNNAHVSPSVPHGRSIWSFELLIPIAIGLVAFGIVRGIVHLAARTWEQQSPDQPSGAEAVVLAIALVMPFAGRAMAGTQLEQVQHHEEAEAAEEAAVVQIDADAKANLSFRGHPLDEAMLKRLVEKLAQMHPTPRLEIVEPRENMTEVDPIATAKVAKYAWPAQLQVSSIPKPLR